MSGGEPSSIKRDVPCAARAPVPQLHAEDFFRLEVISCIRPCTANGGPKRFRMSSASPTSPRLCVSRWRRAAPPMRTSSQAPGAPARPPVPKSWPRPSTASTRWTAIPAASAPPAWASKTAVFWMYWSWTLPPTTVSTRCGPCGTKPSTPRPM